MRKALLIFLALVLVVSGIFYKQILATIDFYQFQNDNATTFSKAKLSWSQIPFTSVTNRGLVEDSLTFGTLLFPIPFEATKNTGANSAFALGSNQSISIAHTSEAEDFFTNNNFDRDTRDALCSFLTETSSKGACVSNYSLYSAFLELNETDVHVFMKVKDKTLYNQLMIIRADMVPSQKVSGFETSRLRGFLFTIDSHNYVVKLFDQQDQQYDITFTNLPQSEVAFVLSNMTVVAN